MTIPTIITLIRIGLIPIFILFFYLPFDWVHIATTTIFTLAAFSDWLDGYLARRLGQASSFGAFLDPVADKLMVAVALVLLIQANPTFWFAIPATIIIGREIAVSALREWMAEIGEGAHVAVNKMGKVKTTFQMIALAFLLYDEPLLGLPIRQLGFILLYIAATLTLWSMIIYLKKALPSINNNTN